MMVYDRLHIRLYFIRQPCLSKLAYRAHNRQALSLKILKDPEISVPCPQTEHQ